MDGYYLDNSYTVFSDVVYADNKFKSKLKLFDLYKDLGLKHRKGCDLDADNIPVKRYPDKDLVGYRLEYMTSERAYNESKISAIKDCSDDSLFHIKEDNARGTFLKSKDHANIKSNKPMRAIFTKEDTLKLMAVSHGFKAVLLGRLEKFQSIVIP